MAFAALGDPTRLAIVERLARGPTSASDLAAPTTISLPAVLKHVRVLEEAGLVTTVKRGRVRECRLRDDALVAVATWTAQQQSLWGHANTNAELVALARASSPATRAAIP